MSTNNERTEFLEVAMILILDCPAVQKINNDANRFNRGRRTFSNSPEVFSTFDGSTIVSSDVLRATDDGEWHSGGQESSVFGRRFVVGVDRRLVDSNPLRLNDFAKLQKGSAKLAMGIEG